ncbi:hypothetical protein [Streptomyces lushanensis]|uniref:hypothetical protein n=1 Tax=Streptomyces lushanensis TaxID=1434255 RepID=UPI0008340697|nr:hypothetical protein [Streptomyces lushanensis]
MTDAFNVVEVVTSGAGVLAAEMARSGWQGVRDALVGFFRRGGDQRAREELRVLDLWHARVLDSTETDREAVLEEVRGMLAIQLAAFLQKYPDAVTELAALVRERESGTAPGAKLTAHSNSNSQVIMSAHSITGGTFTYSPGSDQ